MSLIQEKNIYKILIDILKNCKNFFSTKYKIIINLTKLTCLYGSRVAFLRKHLFVTENFVESAFFSVTFPCYSVSTILAYI